MANNYQFLDAYGSVQTAASSVVAGAHQPLVQIASMVGGLPVTFSGSPSISGAITIVGTPSVSGTVGASIIGLTPVGLNVGGSPVSTANPVAVQPPASGFLPVTVVGSVISQQQGSVLVAQQTSPWVVGTSSVQVVGVMPDQSVSGVGLFHTNHIGNGSVIAIDQVTRNDAVASFLGVDLTPRYMAGDSAGRILGKPFAPEEARIGGYASVNGTSVTTAIGAAGTGLRNYITDVAVANTGSVATLVKFQDGAASLIGFTIAPATGGSNIVGMATPMRTGANTTFDFVSGTASSTLYVTAFGYKAP